MERERILDALRAVRDGDMTPEAALELLAKAPYEDIGFARIDHHRRLRNGNSEVIYGAGKTAGQIAQIAARMAAAGSENILITRLDAEKAAEVEKAVPLFYDAVARVGVANRVAHELVGHVVVASGGTTRLYDVGVAGLHRLLASLDELRAARVVVAVAGMEGALASVVGGLVDCPVIAVPTSVGYGASFGGISALLSMLNACASGVSVVNIDNGFGAGYLANRINRMQGIE